MEITETKLDIVILLFVAIGSFASGGFLTAAIILKSLDFLFCAVFMFLALVLVLVVALMKHKIVMVTKND